MDACLHGNAHHTRSTDSPYKQSPYHTSMPYSDPNHTTTIPPPLNHTNTPPTGSSSGPRRSSPRCSSSFLRSTTRAGTSRYGILFLSVFFHICMGDIIYTWVILYILRWLCVHVYYSIYISMAVCVCKVTTCLYLMSVHPSSPSDQQVGSRIKDAFVQIGKFMGTSSYNSHTYIPSASLPIPASNKQNITPTQNKKKQTNQRSLLPTSHQPTQPPPTQPKPTQQPKQPSASSPGASSWPCSSAGGTRATKKPSS